MMQESDDKRGGRVFFAFRSKWLWICGSLLLIFCLSLLAFQAAVLLAPAKIELQNRLESTFAGHRVRIGAFSTNFFNSISVSPLEISNQGGFSNGTFLKIEEATLSYHLWDVVRLAMRESNNAVTLEISRPDLLLERKNKLWNRPNIKKGKRPLPPIGIIVRGGTLTVLDEQGNLDGLKVMNVNGKLDARPGSPSFVLSAETPLGEKFALKGHLQNPHSLACSFQGINLQPGEFFGRFGVLPSSVTLDGGLDTSCELDCPWPLDLKNKDLVRMKGSLLLNRIHGTFLLGKSSTPYTVEGEIGFSDKRVETRKLSIRTSSSEITLAGILYSPLKERTIDAKVVGNFSIGEWSRETAEGTAQMVLSARGSWTQPVLEGSVQVMNGMIFRAPLSGMAHIHFSTGALELPSLAFAFGKGKITASGSFSKKSLDWNAQVTELSLSDFLKENNAGLRGILTAQLKGGGSPSNPVLSGKMSLRTVGWGSYELLKKFSGILNLNHENFSMNLRSREKGGLMTLQIAGGTPAGMILKKCSLALPSGESLTAEGAFERGSGAIHGVLRADSVPPSCIGPFIKLFSCFNGKLSLNGTVRGTIGDPVFRGLMTGNQMTLAKPAGISAPVGTLKAVMTWDRRSFGLSNISIGSSYRGSFLYWEKPEHRFEVNASVSEGDPKILFALMDAPTDLTGKLNGKISLTHRKLVHIPGNERPVQTAWEGKGDLHCSDVVWGRSSYDRIDLKYSFDGSGLRLDALDFRQNDGGLFLHAEGSQSREKNPLKVQAAMKAFTVSGTRLDGDITSQGVLVLQDNGGASLNIKSENFAVNGFTAGTLTGDVNLKERTLSLKHFQWGSFFNADAQVLFGGGSPLINGKWVSAEKDMKEWGSLLRWKTTPVVGSAAISGAVSGTLAEPVFTLSSDFSKLKPAPSSEGGGEDLEGFYGTGSAVLSNKIMNSLTLKMATRDGGKLLATGQINLNTRELDLKASFMGVDSGIYLDAVGAGELRGQSAGQIGITGPWNDPMVQGKISGSKCKIGNILMDSWDASGQYSGRRFLISRINFYGKRGSWRFSVLKDSWIKPSEDNKSGSFNVITDFANLTLGSVFFVGNADAEGKWSPPKRNEESPGKVLEGTIRVANCSANDYELSPWRMNVRYQNRMLSFGPASRDSSITGEIDFSDLPSILFNHFSVTENQKTIFSMDGEFNRESPDFQMQGSGISAELLSSILESPLTLAGKTDFSVQGRSMGGKEKTLFSGDLSLRNGKMDSFPVDALASKFQWNNSKFDLQSLQAQAGGFYSLRASGTVPFKSGAQGAAGLNLSAKLTGGNLGLLNFMKSDLAKDAKGSFSFDLTLSGDASNPKINGALKISGGEFDSAYLARKLEGMNLILGIKDNRITVAKTVCKVGKGSIRLSGNSNCRIEDGDLVFDGYDLTLETASTSGISLRIPELPLVQSKLGLPSNPSRGDPRFFLRMIPGDRGAPKISGVIALENTFFSWPPPKKKESGGSWLNSIDWDLKLVTGRQTVFQNDYANAKLKGEMILKGLRDDLRINGRIRSEEGTITLYGAVFNLRDSLLELTQPSEVSVHNSSATAVTKITNIAYLQFKAEQNTYVSLPQGGQRVPDIITVQLERTPLTEDFDSKKLSFHSSQDPGLKSERVAARAGIGIDLEGLTPDQSDLQMRQGIARLLDSTLASPIARSLLLRTGLVQNIQIGGEPPRQTNEHAGKDLSTIDSLVGQSISVERNLGSKLSLGYKGTVDKVNDRLYYINQAEVHIPLFKGLSLTGSRELESKDNLGREPESKGEFQWNTKFDFPSLFKSKDKNHSEEPK